MLKDPAILNEFFAPLPVASTCTAESPSMGPSCNNNSNSHSNNNVSPTYLETFTNLERYVQHREGLFTRS
ncbi:unnamed protein product [Anisakis simplex]|uniref:Uncharacterized protein n=1 Tax=Anisakis simplex TaxID=6269 RepID=A0A0M3JBL4_ANISI|nr:unnamed protein product [Anisakis simplex]